jgi:hypothetical protein
MPSRDSSLQNLEKARAKGRPPRPWRSILESQMILRFVFQWLTARGKKPSARAWARALGVSHTWVQKLVRRLTANPNKMWRLEAERGDPRFDDLKRAQESTRQMRERRELRSSRRSRRERLFADRS